MQWWNGRSRGEPTPGERDAARRGVRHSPVLFARTRPEGMGTPDLYRVSGGTLSFESSALIAANHDAASPCRRKRTQADPAVTRNGGLACHDAACCVPNDHGDRSGSPPAK